MEGGSAWKELRKEGEPDCGVLANVTFSKLSGYAGEASCGMNPQCLVCPSHCLQSGLEVLVRRSWASEF